MYENEIENQEWIESKGERKIRTWSPKNWEKDTKKIVIKRNLKTWLKKRDPRWLIRIEKQNWLLKFKGKMTRTSSNRIEQRIATINGQESYALEI